MLAQAIPSTRPFQQLLLPNRAAPCHPPRAVHPAPSRPASANEPTSGPQQPGRPRLSLETWCPRGPHRPAGGISAAPGRLHSAGSIDPSIDRKVGLLSLHAASRDASRGGSFRRFRRSPACVEPLLSATRFRPTPRGGGRMGRPLRGQAPRPSYFAPKSFRHLQAPDLQQLDEESV